MEERGVSRPAVGRPRAVTGGRRAPPASAAAAVVLAERELLHAEPPPTAATRPQPTPIQNDWAIAEGERVVDAGHDLADDRLDLRRERPRIGQDRLTEVARARAAG